MMQISSTKYLPELGMEDPTFLHQYPMDSSITWPLEDLDFQSFSASSPKCFSSNKRFNSNYPNIERPTKQHKISTTWNANYGTSTTDFIVPKPSTSSNNSSSQLISFEHSNASSIASKHDANVVKPKLESGCSAENFGFAAVAAAASQVHDYESKSFLNYGKTNGATVTTARNPTQAQDHVIAERKRREKLSQRFIALSAIVPGLKKMDKASVLGDAIKYLKTLQERVNTLEEQAAQRRVESAVLVKRSILFAEDDVSSSYDDQKLDQPIPEIEARVSGKDVLIRIHCDNLSRRAATILGELEKHNLTFQSSSFLPFGNNALDVTIVAQMNKECCVTAKDLIRSLNKAMKQFI